jgi:hypothetical protein
MKCRSKGWCIFGIVVGCAVVIGGASLVAVNAQDIKGYLRNRSK